MLMHMVGAEGNLSSRRYRLIEHVDVCIRAIMSNGVFWVGLVSILDRIAYWLPSDINGIDGWI